MNMNASNDSNSSYAEKVDSILALIESYSYEYEQETQTQKQNEDEDAVDSISADIDDSNAASNDILVNPVSSHAAEVARQIRQQVNGMRLQIESAGVQIELLHGLRASEESNHSAAMNTLKEEWKRRFKDAKLKHEQATCEQTEINEGLANQNKALKKEEASLKLSLERIISLERGACKKLQEDGAIELEKARSSWQYAEKNHFRKREQKMIPKIKREAAKMVESKLRKLSEKHTDEIRSLERESARELQSYKLELYRNSQKICKNERRNIEAAEKRLMGNILHGHDQKIEEARSEQRGEMTALKQAHEDTMESLRIQHEIDKKRRLEQHEMDLRQAKTLLVASLAQQSLNNDLELKALQNRYNEEIALRKEAIKK